ncbi:nuclear pore complex protein NUP1-like protein isoform X2 [Tanacetum coccineum]
MHRIRQKADPCSQGSSLSKHKSEFEARSRGRTTMYRMAHSPYYRGPSTLRKMPTPSLISSQPAWELERSNGSKMAGKRRSSVRDDLRYGGSMHRIRQKADRCSKGSSLSKHKSEFDLSAQRLLLSCEPEQKASKAIVKNREIGMRNSGFVPTASQMASKILEHLERTIPKEKPSSSARKTEKSATKLTSNLALGSLDKVESSKFLLSSQNNRKSEGQHRLEENGPQRFAIPLIVLSSMNGNSTAPTINAPSPLALPAEPPQKKPAFHMSAPKDFEMSDDDNHSTAPPVQGNAPTTNAASTLALPAEPPQKKPAFQMSAPEVFEVLDDDNHSTAPVQGNASTTNVVSTWSLRGFLSELIYLRTVPFFVAKTILITCIFVMVPSPSSNDDEVAKKVNKLAMAVMDSIDLMAEADPDFPNHGLVCIPQYFGVNAEPLASPNKRPFSPSALMQQREWSRNEEAVLGRLPVRVELGKKSIDLDSILCPSCDNVVESVDHCLVFCEKALSVWDRIFAWWGVCPVDAFTLNDMICHRGGVGMEKEARVLWEVVVLVAAYYIWKSRNLRVFKAKNERGSLPGHTN